MERASSVVAGVPMGAEAERMPSASEVLSFVWLESCLERRTREEGGGARFACEENSTR
jgi:hypothetical protein